MFDPKPNFIEFSIDQDTPAQSLRRRHQPVLFALFDLVRKQNKAISSGALNAAMAATATKKSQSISTLKRILLELEEHGLIQRGESNRGWLPTVQTWCHDIKRSPPKLHPWDKRHIQRALRPGFELQRLARTLSDILELPVVAAEKRWAEGVIREIRLGLDNKRGQVALSGQTTQGRPIARQFRIEGEVSRDDLRHAEQILSKLVVGFDYKLWAHSLGKSLTQDMSPLKTTKSNMVALRAGLHLAEGTVFDSKIHGHHYLPGIFSDSALPGVLRFIDNDNLELKTTLDRAVFSRRMLITWHLSAAGKDNALNAPTFVHQPLSSSSGDPLGPSALLSVLGQPHMDYQRVISIFSEVQKGTKTAPKISFSAFPQKGS